VAAASGSPEDTGLGSAPPPRSPLIVCAERLLSPLSLYEGEGRGEGGGHGSALGARDGLVVGGGEAEGGLELAGEVGLVGEAGGEGDVGWGFVVV